MLNADSLPPAPSPQPRFEDENHGGSAALRRLRQLVTAHGQQLADAFYAQLLQQPESRPFLDHAVVEQRLKPGLVGWLDDLFSDRPDREAHAFEARQRHIGEVHARIGIPLHLVLQGAAGLRTGIAILLEGEALDWDVRFQHLRIACERIDRAMALMSVSSVSGMVQRGQRDEAYRLFALDQDIQVERESQRACLMEWVQTALFHLVDDPAPGDFPHLAHSPFGMWVRHRAGMMFAGSPQLDAIVTAMARVDNDMLPRIVSGDPAVHLRDLRAAVDEIAFLLAELFQGLAGMEAGRDPLTRALNRRFLSSVLTQEIRFANQNRTPLSLLMVDVDHFKQINDTHGHQLGDVVLRHVAEALAEIIRPSDFLFRYGGEEFLILLVETDGHVARQIAERVRTMLAERAFPVGESSLSVTVSIGVFQHDGHPDPDYLVRMADERLLRAKRAGRNRVEAG